MHDQSPASTPVNPYWKAVIVTGFLFCGTTLAMVMSPLGDPKSPASQFLGRHGALLAAMEVGAVLVTSVLAMAVDQRQTRAAAQASHTTSPPEQTSTGESPDVG